MPKAFKEFLQAQHDAASSKATNIEAKLARALATVKLNVPKVVEFSSNLDMRANTWLKNHPHIKYIECERDYDGMICYWEYSLDHNIYISTWSSNHSHGKSNVTFELLEDD